MILEEIYRLLTYTTDPPVFLGKLHISVLLITLFGTVYSVKKYKNSLENDVRRFLFFLWITVAINEVYRSVVFGLFLTDSGFVWDYNWGQFPLQLCSSQLYFLPFVVFLKEGKMRDAFMCFLSTWSLFGGLAVTIYPGNTLTGLVGINLQSMIHHSIQVIVGILLAYRNVGRMNKNTFIRALNLFFTYFSVAMIFNLSMHQVLFKRGMDDVVNMFFLSPYFENVIPFLQRIREATSYNVMVLVYVAGFIAIALIIFTAEKAFFNKKTHTYSIFL